MSLLQTGEMKIYDMITFCSNHHLTDQLDHLPPQIINFKMSWRRGGCLSVLTHNIVHGYFVCVGGWEHLSELSHQLQWWEWTWCPLTDAHITFPISLTSSGQLMLGWYGCWWGDIVIWSLISGVESFDTWTFDWLWPMSGYCGGGSGVLKGFFFFFMAW